MKRKVGSDFGSFIAPLLVKRTDSRQAAEQVEAGAGKAAKEAAVARGGSAARRSTAAAGQLQLAEEGATGWRVMGGGASAAAGETAATP